MPKQNSRKRRKYQRTSRAKRKPDQQQVDEPKTETDYQDEETRPRRVFVCIGATCSDQKSRGILTELKKQIDRQDMGDRVHVYTATCLSHCLRAPVMQVFPEGVFYCNILPRDVRTIVNEHLERGQTVDHFVYDPFDSVIWNDEIDS